MSVGPLQTVTLAALYERQGHFEQARAIYDALLDKSPGNPDLLKRLAALTAVEQEAAGSTTRTARAGAVEVQDQARLERLESLLDRVQGRRR